jgi:hypothetical protein
MNLADYQYSRALIQMLFNLSVIVDNDWRVWHDNSFTVLMKTIDNSANAEEKNE